ncbi:c-Myc-binding protein [Diorhabda sublineata]|uniref:c-Myc-binding protein n=1 Tax=Diorhabda sublineata TaxID=1163346 RepID=UPI0024E0BD0D|nr:c-Myc-binding protein [Diorhabda sublineata]XP_056633543.1 c-Myc-binding protein [Diorhabda sublineata]
MSTPQTYKPSEAKREEFRKYLEKAGIMDALTKVLVSLYEEIDKPEDALNYIIDQLSLQAGLETHKMLNAKLEEVTMQCKALQEELSTLKTAEEVPNTAVEAPEGGEAPEEEAPPAPAEEVPPVEAPEETPQ